MSDAVVPDPSPAPPTPKSSKSVVLFLAAFALTGAGLVIGFVAGFNVAYFASRLSSTLFTQSGSIYTIQGQQGVVNFPLPYRSPPNVEFSGMASGAVVVVECTAQGFTWKNAGGTESWNKGELKWTSRGLR